MVTTSYLFLLLIFLRNLTGKVIPSCCSEFIENSSWICLFLTCLLAHHIKVPCPHLEVLHFPIVMLSLFPSYISLWIIWHSAALFRNCLLFPDHHIFSICLFQNCTSYKSFLTSNQLTPYIPFSNYSCSKFLSVQRHWSCRRLSIDWCFCGLRKNDLSLQVSLSLLVSAFSWLALSVATSVTTARLFPFSHLCMWSSAGPQTYDFSTQSKPIYAYTNNSVFMYECDYWKYIIFYAAGCLLHFLNFFPAL